MDQSRKTRRPSPGELVLLSARPSFRPVFRRLLPKISTYATIQIAMSNTTIASERPDTPDAIALIAELDAILNPLYPSESRHGLSVEKLLAEQAEFFLLRRQGQPAGCAGLKFVRTERPEYAELKRMYVRPVFRGQGLGKQLLNHLAAHVQAKDIKILRLETGIHQREAIALYERFGFQRIPPFAPYREDPVSRCYEKQI
jgi:putative acetyltransferase